MPKFSCRLIVSTLGCISLMLCAPASAVQTEEGILSPSIATLEVETKIHWALSQLGVVQGLSIAIYTPEGTYARGFGVTDMQTQEPATEETAFYIASSTKSMLALALSVLHERGEIDLDQSLSTFAPTAPFPRQINAERITLRNLLAMSSGIKNPAFVHRLAYSGEHDPSLLWSLISKTQPNRARDIRLGHFRYTNWNYNLIARLIEEQRGQPWQDLLAEEVFEKLGMRNTTAYISQAQNDNWSLARPHATLGSDAPLRTYLEKTDATMQSAGGVVMSAKDAVKWLEVLIEDGKVGKEQVFPAAAVRATREPLTEVDTVFSGYVREHYGLGWYIGPYGDAGHRLVHHFGGFPGARAHVSYMPDQKVGVAVFVNDSLVGSRLADLVANYVYDGLIGLSDAGASFEAGVVDIDVWREDLNEQISKLRGEIAVRDWSLGRPLDAYSGTYVNAEYGTVDVAVEQGTLRISNGNLTGLAQAATSSETVRVEMLPLQGQTVEFASDRRGAVTRLTYNGVRFDKQ